MQNSVDMVEIAPNNRMLRECDEERRVVVAKMGRRELGVATDNAGGGILLGRYRGACAQSYEGGVSVK